jgi:hypothetical protein
MPGHSDHQPAVVTEVSWPPILRVGHQRAQVLDHPIEVEGLELLRVIEIPVHRIGQAGVSMENLEVEHVRPPVAIRVVASARERTLHRGASVSLCVHCSSPSCFNFPSIDKDHAF